MQTKAKRLFCLDTKKVAAMAIIIALYVLLSWLSKILNLAVFPVAPFLKIELTDFLMLLAVRLVGIIYATLLTISVSWLQMAYLGDGPIDVFALMLADLIFLIVFWLGDVFLRKGINRLIKNKTSKNTEYLITTSNVILAIIAVSFLMTLFNWLFIYDMYARFLNYTPEVIQWFKSILVPVIIPFNLLKFTINGAIFIAIYRVIIHLEKQFGIVNISSK
ncbi:MAG: ECF transporter S component [Spiroplasma poulsonii]|uniref:Riboflavin transporter RibU n=1 Tax=Spiroplasma poulsonii TaxID=2138 RepID=A0A2P6FBX1_9MOLU|nr:ECF transporter S component [Spiroplasma poulsonii]KAF0851364.1 Riboflavin transporter RibU [Spiroplasma poulsonii]MBW1241705.1 ECF transporter S component [Spiroplasma poulsonii]PQM30957.1 Riboflavin transporter RibU [Spiroplasma poulsonii]PWF95951.1 Riboflavin transporter RibU [Spiroplasma poulsonii]PWF98727.1 Riboflavin transporter RibU [Spiroplasma poulsonii]